MKCRHVSWIEIDTLNLQHNIKQLRQTIGPNVILCPTVKANAYGHGLEIAAKAFLEAGADWLSVHSLEDAKHLRGKGVSAPLYIFGYVASGQLEEVVKLDCRIVVYDKERLPDLNSLAEKNNKTVHLHLKLETGIHRQGVNLDQAIDIAYEIINHKNLKLEGLCSHFANIEDTSDHSYAEQQLDFFNKAIKKFEEESFTIPIKHIANSAATILYPETHLSMVRPGLAAYGMWPAEITRQAAKDKGLSINLKPALTWKSLVAQVKNVEKGKLIGYGCSYKTPKNMHIAIVPVGYYEGLDRATGPSGFVLVQKTRCKILGRVCMNNIMIDVSHLKEVTPEEEVVLLGNQGSENISAEEFAGWSNRINYQATTCISTGIDNSIPRIAM